MGKAEEDRTVESHLTEAREVGHPSVAICHHLDPACYPCPRETWANHLCKNPMASAVGRAPSRKAREGAHPLLFLCQHSGIGRGYTYGPEKLATRPPGLSHLQWTFHRSVKKTLLAKEVVRHLVRDVPSKALVRLRP